ncbi:MAG: glycosyltransferase family 4 protein [bacterium]
MNLAMFHDWIIWRDSQGYFLDDAFIRFVTAFDRDFDRITFWGRVADSGDERSGRGQREIAYPLDSRKHQVCPFPYYSDIYSLYTRGPVILPQIWRSLKQNLDQWDLVWLPAPHPIGVMAACLCRRKNKPFFFLVRQNLTEQVRHRCRGARRTISIFLVHLLEWLSQRISRQALIFTVGQEMLSRYRENHPLSFPVIISLVSGQDLQNLEAEYRPGPPLLHEPIRLLSAGRLDPEKGLPYLIQAVDRLLKEEKRQISLTIIGRGKEEPLLRQEAEKRGLAAAVKFAGYVKHGPELLSRFREHDVFVLPSLTGEGLPQTILEAMACKLPVIATSVAGIPCFIRDKINGLLIPPADSHALCRAILTLADDAVLRSRIIDGGRQTIASHTLEAEKEKMMIQIRKYLLRP